MSTTSFESSVKQIPYSQQTVYGKLSDLNNLSKVRDRLPADKAGSLSFDADSMSIEVPMAGKIKMVIIERDEPKTIKFESRGSPVPFLFWIQLLPTGDAACKMRLTLHADLNPFIKGMVQKQLQEGIEKAADMLAMLPYDD